MPKASSQVLTDHDQIQNWAEQRGAKPSCVRRTGGGDDIGMIRLDFPGYSGADSLEEVSWDEWFDKFDESNLALVVQEHTARGQTSNFNKLVSRDSVEESSSSQSSRPSARAKQSTRRNSGRKQAASRSTGTRASKTAKVQGSRSKKKAPASTSRKRTTARSTKRAGASTRGKRVASVRGRSKSSGRRAA
jgi:hypothetical protein